MTEQKKNQEERIKKALERAKAEPKKNVSIIDKYIFIKFTKYNNFFFINFRWEDV